MGKPALGRGLGNLMGGAQVAAKPEPAGAKPDDAAAAASPGLDNLLTAGRRGASNGGAGTPAAAERPATPEKSLFQDYRPLSIYKPEVPPPPPVAAAPAPEPADEIEPVQAPRWSLIGADLLLVALAALLVFKSPAPLRPWEMALCIAAVVFGALLACLAALTGPPRRR